MTVGKSFIDLYGANIRFFIEQDREDIIKYTKKNYGQEFAFGDVAGACLSIHSDGAFISLIYLRDRNDITSLSHECIHSAMDVLANVGVEVCTKNHEALTYLHDHIMLEALKHIKKLKKK